MSARIFRAEALVAEPGAGDSAFEVRAFDRRLGGRIAERWMAWRRRSLVLAALLGCLGVFSLARWLAAMPQIDARWSSGAAGQLVLLGSADPALDAWRQHVVVGVRAPQGTELALDAGLLHHALRWLPDDEARAKDLAMQHALASLLDTAGARGTLLLRMDDGSLVRAALRPPGYARLGAAVWPQAAMALVLYLCAAALLLARLPPRNLLFICAALCQAANLMLGAAEAPPGISTFGARFGVDPLLLRALLDLCSGAAVVQAYAAVPRRLPHAAGVACAAWAAPLLWLLLSGPWPARWATAQGLCLALGGAAVAVGLRSHRLEPNPYALVMSRLAVTAVVGFGAASAVVWATATASAGPAVALAASVLWGLLFGALLLLTPFLARTRYVVREFVMLAGISAVAVSLDALFIAFFSLRDFTSLAIVVFVALALYASTREWVLNRLGSHDRLRTERAFEHLYRAAREVQARPAQYVHQLGRLLRDLYDPLEMMRAARVPPRSRVVGGGSALVVPLRGAEGAAAAALVLRFAQRGQRLFTLDDARLADRIVEQLRRAVAYDQAVEHGRHQERQRIAQDLHDDIGARLLTLMYRAPTPEMENYIRHTLQDLKTLTRGLAASEHLLSHAAAEWKSDLTQRLSAAQARLGWNFSADRDLRLSMAQWSALTRVLRELVSNALVHGGASRVEISFALEGRRLTLSVADDGCGREPRGWTHGLGLGGVRKRVKQLGGSVQWRENEPSGIVCAVLVPDFDGPANEAPAAYRAS